MCHGYDRLFYWCFRYYNRHAYNCALFFQPHMKLSFTSSVSKSYFSLGLLELWCFPDKALRYLEWCWKRKLSNPSGFIHWGDTTGWNNISETGQFSECLKPKPETFYFARRNFTVILFDINAKHPWFGNRVHNSFDCYFTLNQYKMSNHGSDPVRNSEDQRTTASRSSTGLYR